MINRWQVSVANGASSITLSLPQSIATSSSVQFGQVGVNEPPGILHLLCVFIYYLLISRIHIWSRSETSKYG